MRAPLFDSHCHLDFPSLLDELPSVIARAREAGVTRITTIGAGRGPGTAGGALAIARQYPGFIWATVGIHPHDARHATHEAREDVESLAADPLVVAIGETGLDYHYDLSPREEQQDSFRWAIALARSVKKPLVIHTREAAQDTLAVLREERASDVGGIIHCFSEDAPFALAALELGFVSSFSGIVTFPKATAVHDAARALPLDAILIETDAPFLAPPPHRGKRNEPAFVTHVADAIARLRGTDPDSLRSATFTNASRLYHL